MPMPVEDSYEGFGELTERANQWLEEYPDNILVTNMMSVMVQKDGGVWSVMNVRSIQFHVLMLSSKIM